MPRTLRIASLLCALVFAAGCGADPDPGGGTEADPFEGTYKVTSHTKNGMDCNGPGADVTDGDAFFSLTEESFLGTPILAYRACTDATTCDESIGLLESFIDEGNGWMRQVKSSGSSGGSSDCSLGLVEGPLVKTETGLELEIKSYSGTITLAAGETCDTDLVDAHRAELMCSGTERITADKL